MGRVRGRVRGGSMFPHYPPHLHPLKLGKTQTQSKRIFPVKIGTSSDGYPRVRVLLPCLVRIQNMFGMKPLYLFSLKTQPKRNLTSLFFLVTQCLLNSSLHSLLSSFLIISPYHSSCFCPSAFQLSLYSSFLPFF